MSDRLTQLQICLDQLIEQFNAAVNYVNVNSEPALLDDDPRSVINIAVEAPILGQTEPHDGTQEQSRPDDANSVSVPGSATASSNINPSQAKSMEFNNTLSELSTDIILKSRQITMLIDSLPGVGVSEDAQVDKIKQLSQELGEVENKRIEMIKQKEQLVAWCEELITDVAKGISSAKV